MALISAFILGVSVGGYQAVLVMEDTKTDSSYLTVLTRFIW